MVFNRDVLFLRSILKCFRSVSWVRCYRNATGYLFISVFLLSIIIVVVVVIVVIIIVVVVVDIIMIIIIIVPI